MRAPESYRYYLLAGLILSVGMLVLVQATMLGEPGRIEASESGERAVDVAEGGKMYGSNCAGCHGAAGEGGIGPTLNEARFLSESSDTRLAAIIAAGIPRSGMPTWGQEFGGSLTTQEVDRIVTYMRSWEISDGAVPTAVAAVTEPAVTVPPATEEPKPGDLTNGLSIFKTNCQPCHGERAAGTGIGPALSTEAFLESLDDAYFIEVISEGRLAEGMPAWKDRFSEADILSVVQVLRAWQRGEEVGSVQ